VLGEQFVDHGQGAGGSAVLFPRRARPGHGQLVLLTTGQADVGTDVLAGFEQRDVGDEQPDQPFAFPHRGGRVVPERGQVAGQGADAVDLAGAERGVAADAGLVVVVLGVGELAEPVVPVGFQGVGDEPVGGVDGQVATPRGVGGVLGAFHVGGTEPVGVGGLFGQFGADGQRGLQGHRGEGGEHELGDGGVDA
jgi:hypothetical protein